MGGSSICIRPSREEDTSLLVPNLRDADLEEIRASAGRAPGAVLKHGYRNSLPCLTVCVPWSSHPVDGMFGVVPGTDPRNTASGTIWLLGTAALFERPVAIMRIARVWIDRLQQDYEVLWNCIDLRNSITMGWLSDLGFARRRVIPRFGVERRPFVEMTRARSPRGTKSS